MAAPEVLDNRGNISQVPFQTTYVLDGVAFIERAGENSDTPVHWAFLGFRQGNPIAVAFGAASRTALVSDPPHSIQLGSLAMVYVDPGAGAALAGAPGRRWTGSDNNRLRHGTAPGSKLVDPEGGKVEAAVSG